MSLFFNDTKEGQDKSSDKGENLSCVLICVYKCYGQSLVVVFSTPTHLLT